MPLRYREKIRLRRPSHLEIKNPKIETDLKDIHKTLDIETKPVKKPKDLTNIITEIKGKFSMIISPFVSGEYKKNSHPRFVYDSAKKTIKLRYQLMSIKENLLDFVFQLRLYVISHSDDKDKIKELEKEIKEWEKIINKTLNEIIDNISFVIENYFVPIVNKLEKKKVSS